uniref:Uncharacterized protein n=1 Tax=Rhizophora mucronata TaxID=61149 RepID=A0A2P2QMP7_RHIMU
MVSLTFMEYCAVWYLFLPFKLPVEIPWTYSLHLLCWNICHDLSCFSGSTEKF